MARVFLHIGAFKTGTTYLQNLFHLNRTRLARAGVIYPECGPHYAQHALAALWVNVPEAVRTAAAAGGAEHLWQHLADTYAKAPGTLFLSSELFLRAGEDHVDLEELAARLAPFEDVRIVYTMRRQAELVQSVWLQLARAGNLLSIHPFVRHAFEQRNTGGVWVDHNSIHQNLLRHFSAEQILLLDYHQASHAPGGIAQAFLDLLGADLQVAELDKPDRDVANISPDPLAFFLATRVARNAVPSPELVSLIAEALQREGHRPTSLLARYEYVKFRSRFGPGNATLAERIQPVQPGFSFLEADPPEDMLFRDELDESQWIEIASTLFEGSQKSAPVLGRFLGR
jgi:hypothetical protein